MKISISRRAILGVGLTDANDQASGRIISVGFASGTQPFRRCRESVRKSLDFGCKTGSVARKNIGFVSSFQSLRYPCVIHETVIDKSDKKKEPLCSYYRGTARTRSGQPRNLRKDAGKRSFSYRFTKKRQGGWRSCAVALTSSTALLTVIKRALKPCPVSGLPPSRAGDAPAEGEEDSRRKADWVV